MKIKNWKLGSSFVAVTVILTSVFSQAAQAQSVDCDTKIIADNSYKTYHQGPALGFTGGMEITNTYDCAKGTCFEAVMTFDNYGAERDKAQGYMKGSNIRFTRYISRGGAQKWTGQCLQNSVRGSWDYTPVQPGNRGKMSITY